MTRETCHRCDAIRKCFRSLEDKMLNVNAITLVDGTHDFVIDIETGLRPFDLSRR